MGHDGLKGPNGHNRHYGPTRYGHKYAHHWCLWKEQEKCRSPAKTELKKMYQVKNCSQIEIDSGIVSVSFVCLPHFCLKLTPVGQALTRGPQSSSLCF